MSHLTERTYTRLVAGDLPAEEARALSRHLSGACEVCEAFLDARPADAVDGHVDALLARHPGAGVAGNDLEFARIERRLREPARPAPRPARPLVPALVAALVLVAGLSGITALRGRTEGDGWDGVKGSAARTAPPVRLRFLVVTPTPEGPPALEKGVSGQAVPRGASLQFEIEAGRPGQAALVRVPARGAPELVWSERVGSGRAVVTLAGRPAAYPLAELEGRQRFVVVASEERLAPDRLARAAESLAPPAPAPSGAAPLDGLGLDVVDVEVR